MGHWSGGHLYMDNRSNKSVNIKYALIEHEGKVRVFDSISGAENFCAKHGLDPDEVIQSWTQEVKDRCKQIASERLVALEEVQESQKAGWDRVLAYVDERAKIKEEHENNPGRNWDKSLDEEYLTQAQGMVQGYHEAMKNFDRIKSVYLNILYFS